MLSLFHENKTPQEASLYSPLALAYLGDGVYELLVRDMLVSKKNQTVNSLHKAARAFVSAKAQSAAVEHLFEYFSETELNIYKRGRNANPQTTPKNTEISQYLRATGLEAVFGFLYLVGDTGRIMELFNIVKNREQKDN